MLLASMTQPHQGLLRTHTVRYPGLCQRGSKCWYAHGKEELRNPQKHASRQEVSNPLAIVGWQEGCEQCPVTVLRLIQGHRLCCTGMAIHQVVNPEDELCSQNAIKSSQLPLSCIALKAEWSQHQVSYCYGSLHRSLSPAIV